MLQAAGVHKDHLERFLEVARDVLSSSGACDVQEKFVKLKLVKKDLHQLVEAVPEPPAEEAKFLVYMRKHSTKIGAMLRQLGQHSESAAAVALKMPDHMETLTTARQLVADATNAVSIFTFVTVLRYPAIRSPKAHTMRSNLRQIMDQMMAESVACPDQYFGEAHEILVACSEAGAELAKGESASSSAGGARLGQTAGKPAPQRKRQAAK